MIFLYFAKVPPSFFSRNTTPVPGNGINPALPDPHRDDDQNCHHYDEICTWDDVKDDHHTHGNDDHDDDNDRECEQVYICLFTRLVDL